MKVQLKDVDFDRKMLHIVAGKGKKDRYVPLPEMLIRGLKIYIDAENPVKWLFNGRPDKKGKATPYSPNSIQWIIREARKNTGQLKEITAHIFRHSYATHLLEDGLDIMSIKDLLGHATIATTMVYLHVAKLKKHRVFSPLETLYKQ